MILILLAAALNGCRVTGETEKPDTGNTAAASPGAGNALLEAVRKNDYKAFAAGLGENAREICSPEEFRASREKLVRQFGEIRSFRFLSALETPVVCNQVWLVSFERKNSRGEMVRQDLLFRLVTGMDNGKLKVIGFGFI